MTPGGELEGCGTGLGGRLFTGYPYIPWPFESFMGIYPKHINRDTNTYIQKCSLQMLPLIVNTWQSAKCPTLKKLGKLGISMG